MKTKNEQNYYGVVAYQKSSGDLNYQILRILAGTAASISRRIRWAIFISNGVASDVERKLIFGRRRGRCQLRTRRHPDPARWLHLS